MSNNKPPQHKNKGSASLSWQQQLLNSNSSSSSSSYNSYNKRSNSGRRRPSIVVPTHIITVVINTITVAIVAQGRHQEEHRHDVVR